MAETNISSDTTATKDRTVAQPSQPNEPRHAEPTAESGAHLAEAKAHVFGDDPLQQKGHGSRFANATPAAKANMYVAELRTIADEVIALTDSLLAASKRLADASRQAGEHTQAAARERQPPPPVR